MLKKIDTSVAVVVARSRWKEIVAEASKGISVVGVMRKLLEEIERTMLASTFAEAGEYDIARSFLQEDKNAHRKVLLGTDAEAITPRLLKAGSGALQEDGREVGNLPPDPGGGGG